MDLEELFLRFAMALGIGLLVGIERGWQARGEEAGARTAGIRTFSLIGSLGGVVGALAQAVGGSATLGGGLLLGLAFAAFASAFALFCWEQNRAERTFSATTAVAGMVTFALGAYAVVGEPRVAAASAVVITGLLALREALHRWLVNLKWEELRAGLILLAMTFVALPVIPGEEIGPLGGLNPRQIWLLAIVLAGVSFLGYAMVQHFGARRGVLLAAAAGGLVSSTAVMATNARRAGSGEGSARLLAAGASMATAVALVRTIVLVGALNPDLLKIVTAPLAAGAAVSAAAALWLAWKPRDAGGSDPGLRFANPFDLKSVFGFAVLLGAVLIVSRMASERFGTGGVLAAALVTGLADTDSIAYSMATLAPGAMSVAVAGLAVLAAVASNMLSKLAIGVVAGRGVFAVLVAGATALAFAAGAAALALAWPLLPD